MSSFNYMDNVPVKIAENYKRPPRLYQIPQAIANKLALPPEHYYEAPQYSYDFQLERKVLAKIPEWQRMRQQEREARRERKEKREQQRLLELEAHQKQKLGAVSYPSAEELSSTDSDEADKEHAELSRNALKSKSEEKSIVSNQACSFHNILQPTILPRSMGHQATTAAEGADSLYVNSLTHPENTLHANVKLSSAFNYKDFEDDTSSPFDNIELKTINDLDILAQVLHNTQLSAKKQDIEEELEVEKTKDNMQNADTHAENVKNSNDTEKEVENTNDIETPTIQDAVNLAILENTKAALEKVDFTELNQQLQNENIPNAATTTSQQPLTNSNNYVYHHAPVYRNFANQQQTAAYMPYNQHLYNGLEQQQQQHQQHYSNYNLQQQQQHSAYNNQNYLYNANCNGGISAGSGNVYFSPTHNNTRYVTNNANNYLRANITANAALTSPQLLLVSQIQLNEVELNSKSKSVPDILKEINDEVHNSKIRRSRNHSQTLEDDTQVKAAQETTAKTLQQTTKKIVARKHESQCYAKLEASAQKLAKTISSMGFPLERVAKIAQMFGADDKKIIEHLIPLSELMDLGFDETKISEALMKFDNNKEKALEYLIS